MGALVETVVSLEKAIRHCRQQGYFYLNLIWSLRNPLFTLWL
jgi:hypothetical protein